MKCITCVFALVCSMAFVCAPTVLSVHGMGATIDDEPVEFELAEQTWACSACLEEITTFTDHKCEPKFQLDPMHKQLIKELIHEEIQKMADEGRLILLDPNQPKRLTEFQYSTDNCTKEIK